MVSTFSAGRKEASSSQESIQLRHHTVGLQLEIVILGALLAAAAGTHDPVSQPSCSTEQVDALTASLYSRLGRNPISGATSEEKEGHSCYRFPSPRPSMGVKRIQSL